MEYIVFNIQKDKTLYLKSLGEIADLLNTTTYQIKKALDTGNDIKGWCIDVDIGMEQIK